MAENTVFNTLNAINVNEHVERKNTGKTSLAYLSWSWAWAEVKKTYPEANYEIIKFENGLPYAYDPKTGYMVYTKVTINNITHEMWLPVMDSHNEAMLDHPRNVKTKFSEFTVDACTMFDVNKTIMRCLTKNLAMFGLGLYIYSGEDLPSGEDVFTEDELKEVKLNLETFIANGALDSNPKLKTEASALLETRNYKRILDCISYCKKISA